MRIVRVSYRVPPLPGGMERHVECLTREQVAQGHEVTMAFRHGSVVQPGATRLPLRGGAVPRTLAHVSDRLAFAAQAAAAIRRLCDDPRAHGVDLVHLHGDHVEGLVLGPVCRHLRVPLFLTVHASLTHRRRSLQRRVFRDVTAFVALGSATAADLVARGVDERRVLTMSSGLELSAMPSPSEAVPRERGLIVSVGALNPMKNHTLLVEAFDELSRRRPWLRLVVAGDGPERDRLARMAATRPGVELAGPLSRAEVYELVRRAEVFVLASRRLRGKGEGVPTAALEALALGAPVVVSSDASLDPVVPDREAWRVFESGSKADLVRALGAVLDDEPARRKMSALGVSAAAALDWPRVAERVENWYRVQLRQRYSAT
ncbi:glycosyltransferase family 4 protein [Streptomyces luteolifulvus]|uniref:Glycosyltransferase family 4 protein n=1 Tax=Streptomyces luteolifulvus TaxID=2615112 RepID=A0A6H9UR22_9ACTN|nr:glycosyltransferase family 4 protein [Streptomyces luteolifulvus]KAB1140770.1 glycosyltransferase family 4 protein [Streptomyces luteolifulvus]